MIEHRSISKTLSARSYTTVLPEVARRSPATSTPPENLKARIVVASVGSQLLCCNFPTGPTGSTIAAGPSSPLRRSSVGKSSAAPEKVWSALTKGDSIIGQCAGDSALIDWDRPCAFFLKDLLCPVSRHPANAAPRHRLALGPTEPDRLAFGCAQACKNLRAKIGKASCGKLTVR